MLLEIGCSSLIPYHSFCINDMKLLIVQLYIHSATHYHSVSLVSGSDSRILLGDMPIAVTVADLVRALGKTIFRRSDTGTASSNDLAKVNDDGMMSDSVKTVDLPNMDTIDPESIEELKDNAAQLMQVSCGLNNPALYYALYSVSMQKLAEYENHCSRAV